MIPINWGSTLPWRWLELKIEEVFDGNSESNGERFDGFERRGIETTFYKAEEINRDIQKLRELLLSHQATLANRAQLLSELLPQSSHT